jgi:hypothetical protein
MIVKDTIEDIYHSLYFRMQRTFGDELPTQEVLKFVGERLKTHPDNNTLKQFQIEIINLKAKIISPIFVERFCLQKLSNYILDAYAVNVAEAFILGYIVLNKPVEINSLYFKIGMSGLVGPTVVRGERISDIEAISQFLIKSLTDAQLINVTDNQLVLLGKQFVLDI